MDEPHANIESQDSPQLDLREATTFPLIVLCVHGHNAYTQMSFCLGIPKLGLLKFLKLRFSQLWRPITSCANLRLRGGWRKSYSLCRELSNGMWHVTCTQVNQGNSKFLVVGTNLILSPSFDHKLCFKYPNGSCDPILNIYVSRTFRWYKKLFNLMSFDSCNCFLKIQKSIKILILEVGAHLGVCGFILSHSPTFPGT